MKAFFILILLAWASVAYAQFNGCSPGFCPKGLGSSIGFGPSSGGSSVIVSCTGAIDTSEGCPIPMLGM